MNKMLFFVVTMAILVNVVMFIIYERKKPGPKEILPIVVICCGAALGRVIFAVFPQVQPVTVLVIIAAGVYGSLTGYVTGALCALVSNLFLGQGPWTLFQMLAWGLVGWLAGLMGKLPEKKDGRLKRNIFAVYSFFAAFFFSFVTDFLTVAYLGEGFSWTSAIAVFLTGMAFNIGHAVCNVIFMLLLYPMLSRKLMRIRGIGS